MLTLALTAASRARGLRQLALIVAAGWAARVAVYIAAAPHWSYTAIDAVTMMFIAPRAVDSKYPGRGIYAVVAAILLFQAGFRLAVTALADAAGPAQWLSDVLAHGLNRTFDLTLLVLIAYSALRLVRRKWPVFHAALWKRDGNSLKRNFAQTLAGYYAEAERLSVDPEDGDAYLAVFFRHFRQAFLGAEAPRDAQQAQRRHAARAPAPWR